MVAVIVHNNGKYYILFETSNPPIAKKKNNMQKRRLLITLTAQTAHFTVLNKVQECVKVQNTIKSKESLCKARHSCPYSVRDTSF